MNPSRIAEHGGFIADDGSPEIVQPAVSSLDFVATLILPNRSTILSRLPLAVLPMRANQLDLTLLLQSLSQRIAICSLVVQQVFRGFPGNLQVVQQRLDQFHFASIGGSEVDTQRCSFGIDDVDHLAAFTTLGLSNLVPPFLARTNQASAAASLQSMSCSSSSSMRSEYHSPSKMPQRVHSSNRRQQVLGDGKHFGNFSHWQPVKSTNRIPSRQARCECGGRPPLGCESGSGIRCLMRSHCASERYVFPVRSIFRVHGMSETPLAHAGMQLACQTELCKAL